MDSASSCGGYVLGDLPNELSGDDLCSLVLLASACSLSRCFFTVLPSNFVYLLLVESCKFVSIHKFPSSLSS